MTTDTAEVLKIHTAPSVPLSAKKEYKAQLLFSGKSFEATAQGTYSHFVKTYLNTKFPISQKAFDSASSEHTGHNIIRHVVNYMMAENLNKICAYIINHPDEDITLIDVGSKFGKNIKLFSNLASLTKSKVRLICVRPSSSIYDKNYYYTNTTSLSNCPSNYSFEVYQGYLQDLERDHEFIVNCNKTSVIYFLNDCHYYLAGWKPVFKKSHIYISGGMFSATPGYGMILPFAQGTYDVIPMYDSFPLCTTQVRMTTLSSGDPYVHPNVYVSGISDYIDYGWYKQFNAECPAEDLIIEKYLVPAHLSYTGNAQSRYILNATKDLGLKTRSAHVFQNNTPLTISPVCSSPIDKSEELVSLFFSIVL